MRSSPFIQSILLAAISVVPAAAITSLPASCGTNLFANPSFENGVTTGWTYQYFTPGESTDQHSDGAKSMLMLTSPSANNFGQTVYGLDITQSYDISIDYKAIVNPSAAAGFTCYLMVYLSIPQGFIYQSGPLKFTADGNDKGFSTLKASGMRLPYPSGVFVGFNVYCMAPAGGSMTGTGTLYFDNAIIASPCPVSTSTDISTPSAPVSTPSAPVSTPSTDLASSTPTPVASSTTEEPSTTPAAAPSTTPSASTPGTDVVTPTVTTPDASITTPVATPTTLSTVTTPISSTESSVSDLSSTTSTPTDLASAPTPTPSRRPCRSRRMRRSEPVSEIEL
ncbi:unnamed protein product [Clonostachys rosea]|uniref:CBM-cenC domain-containing protein n=1 Tax=Bionectria ochroleuca TaxID=29856 RepID=A0ABY6U285_BIOOC|nr:unnamed protein product [Clonostachys rosea]